MGVETDVKRWYHKGWPQLLIGFFFGLMFAAMIIRISGAQLWTSFKMRFLTPNAG